MQQRFVPQAEGPTVTVSRETSLAGRSLAFSESFLKLKRKASRLTISRPGEPNVTWTARNTLIERAVGFDGARVYVAAEPTAESVDAAGCNRYRLYASERGNLWKQVPLSAGETARWYLLSNRGEVPRPMPYLRSAGEPPVVPVDRFNVNETLISCNLK